MRKFGFQHKRLQCEQSLSLCPCSKNPVISVTGGEPDGWDLCHSDDQKWSVFAAGALYGANNSLFQTSSRKIKSETKKKKHCVAKFSCRLFFTRLCTVLGCLLLSELSRCADKEGAGFFFSFIDLLGLVHPLVRLALESKEGHRL